MHHRDHDDVSLQARRKFLATCGKFAVVTPPAVTLLLSATNRAYAHFASGMGPGGEGGGEGDHHHHHHHDD